MTIRALITDLPTNLTPSERKLVTVFLADYPYAALVSIQDLAHRAKVSAPSISRFVSKLGLTGYPEFQRQLLQELKTGQQSPVDLHRSNDPIEGGYLNEFLSRASAQMQTAGSAITEAQFQRVCDLLGDPKRNIYTIGGRVSDTIALHLSFHLRQARQGVEHLPRDPDAWPEYLLRLKPGDIFFIVDFRRYQTSLEGLADCAAQQCAKVVLLTDKWLSPAIRHASEVLAVPIETGTLWDSYAAALALVEALSTKVAETQWNDTRSRIEAWDALRQENPETPS
jgi:DNA-binding MurR/RpiR family transcriptional regulator